jgi:hypothetical protein
MQLKQRNFIMLLGAAVDWPRGVRAAARFYCRLPR